jgi:hypothetical protein
MTLRVALQPDESAEDSVTLAQAARRLGCDPATVRAMLRRRLLAGHKVGKTDKPTGIRVKVWSLIAWEERHAIGLTDDEPAPPRRPRPRSQANPALAEAQAFLRSMGVRVG